MEEMVEKAPDVTRLIDRLAGLAARVTAAPVALISLIDSDRQFFKSTVGLPRNVREVPLTHSLCKHVVNDGLPLVLRDARLDDERGLDVYAARDDSGRVPGDAERISHHRGGGVGVVSVDEDLDGGPLTRSGS